ncbi:MAG: TolC family protein [Bacteroidota bacterium]|nr:TolC family protein [Bacteroidota bacterium]
MNYKIIIALFTALFLAVSTQAQQKLSLTVDQAVQIGLENSKALKTSNFKVIAAEAKSGETNALGLPSLKFNGSYTRLSEVPASAIPNFINPALPPIVLSPAVVNNYGLKATLQQPLFTGWKVSGAEDAAEYSAEATKQDFGKDKAEVIYNIKAAYWNVYRAIEFKKFVDQNVDQMKSHAVDAENLMKQGLLTTNDLLKVQVQLSDALVRQIDAKNNVQLSIYALNNTLGLPLVTEIELASTIELNDRTWANVDQLIKNAFEKRPDLLAMNARVKASEAGLTSARGSWWPQIYLVGNYNYLRPNPRIFPTKDEFKDTWDVSVSVSFDIWNWNQTGNQTTQAQAQLSQSEQGLSMMMDGVTLEVTQNYLAVNQAKERKTVSEQGVAQAEENYRVMNDKYKKGLAPNSELLDAEVALLQAKLNLTQSLVDYELSTARLSKAVGE